MNEYDMRAAAQDAYNKETARLLKSAMGPAIGAVPAASVVPHISDSDPARVAGVALSAKEDPRDNYAQEMLSSHGTAAPSLNMLDSAWSDYNSAATQNRQARSLGMPQEAMRVYEDRANDRRKTLEAVINAARYDSTPGSLHNFNSYEQSRPENAVGAAARMLAATSFPVASLIGKGDLEQMGIGSTRAGIPYGPVSASIRSLIYGSDVMNANNPYRAALENPLKGVQFRKINPSTGLTDPRNARYSGEITDNEVLSGMYPYVKPTYNGGPVPGPAGMLMRDAQSTAAKNVPSVFQPPSPVMTTPPTPAAPKPPAAPTAPTAPAAPSAPK